MSYHSQPKFEGITGDSEVSDSMMVDYTEFAKLQMLPLKTSETMTKEEYYKFVEKTFADMLELIKRKNKDYCGVVDDPFANFRRASQVSVDPLNGLAVRFLDKVARIESFFQSGKLENESFEDAWLDCIGYSCLALGMLKERRDVD
jgi:hypothetical protein